MFAFGSAAKANIQANNKAEQWTVIHGKIERDEVQSYPFSTTISKAPIIAFSDGFITFGGAGDAGLIDIVALMRGGVWVSQCLVCSTKTILLRATGQITLPLRNKSANLQSRTPVMP